MSTPEKDREELKDQTEARTLEAIKRDTNALSGNTQCFTCGTGDWSLVHDGCNFFLINANDDDDVIEVRIKVEIEFID